MTKDCCLRKECTAHWHSHDNTHVHDHPHTTSNSSAITSKNRSSCLHHGTFVDLNGHTHSPTCGHQLVRHGDHCDYIGDDGMLHHLLDNADCCDDHKAAGTTVVVSHGAAAVLPSLFHRRRATTPTPTTTTTSSTAVEFSDALSTSSPTATATAPLMSTKIYCQGVCCPMEIPVVESALHRMPGVVSVEVAVVTKTVTVSHNPAFATPAALVAALNEARLSASLTFPRLQTKGTRSWLPPWYVLVSIVLLLISCLHYLSGPLNQPWMENFKWVALAPVALCLPGIALKALGALRHFVLDIHFLIALAAAGAIAIGDYSEASIVVVLFCIADFLEERCTGQARDAISAVLALKPDVAVLAESGEEVPAADVVTGTMILIRAGDKAPLDGVVVSGSTAFDESILTGESLAVVKHPGDSVCAGTLNSGTGLVHVRTTTNADDTFVAGMARLVEQATSRQSPSEAAVAKFAKYYTPLVVLACILLAFVPWSDPNADRTWWVYLALQVLVTACPCALVLSTPVTVVSALARAAQVGVLIKGGVILESLADVKVVTLDKTGTLTVGAFMVEGVAVAEGVDEAHLLHLLGSLERGSNHPLAAAIVGRAAARGVGCDAEVSSSAAVPGQGIEGIVEASFVRAGTAEFLRELFHDSKDAASLLKLAAAEESCAGRGVSTCFVAVDGKYAACITGSDSLRPEAAEAVAALRTAGVTPAMLTGDNSSVATAIAAAAGIAPEHTHASLLPQDKLDLVASYKLKEFPAAEHRYYQYYYYYYSRFEWSRVLCFWRKRQQKKGRRIRVAHVGDGVNDAPALAAADVGIAMGVAGAAAALEAGDVALFTNDLRVVPALQRLARAASNKIVFNITLSVVTKVLVLVLAALGKFTLFGAVLVDVGTALLVTLNGLTLLRWDFGLGNAAAVCVGAAAVSNAAAAVTTTTACEKSCCGGASAAPSRSSCNSTSTIVNGGGGGGTCCGGDHKHHHHNHHSHGHEHGGDEENGKAVEMCCSKKSSNCCGGGEDPSSSVAAVPSKACCGSAAEEGKKSCCSGKKSSHDHHHHHHEHKHDDGSDHIHDETAKLCCGHSHGSSSHHHH